MTTAKFQTLFERVEAELVQAARNINGAKDDLLIGELAMKEPFRDLPISYHLRLVTVDEQGLYK